MAKILLNEELIAVLKADYSAKTINKESLLRRQRNIDTFNALERKQLKYDKLEKRIMLYTQARTITIRFSACHKMPIKKMLLMLCDTLMH